MSKTDKTVVGIDAMAFYVPSIYLDIKELAMARNLEYEKLNKGLGLEKMALPDINEDAASMAASAVWKLLKNYAINPKDIGRLYVGTESGVDGAKPIATYVLGMLNTKLQEETQTQEEFFANCDAVDMTFACIGGVDALHNTLDWVRGKDTRMGIVVCSDYAKYEKNSGGEYTQGAGAVAMLVKSNPRLVEIRDTWGISMRSEHDFFKPNFSETPVFDGQFSNNCYQNRLTEAYFSFKRQAQEEGVYQPEDKLIDKWEQLIFHLPYAFQGSRMFKKIFTEEQLAVDNTKFLQELGIEKTENTDELVNLVGKSEVYKSFCQQKIADGQKASSLIGNMYTASIFMALMSYLETSFSTNKNLSGQKIGFCAYGSGSKSKVFEGIIQPAYKDIVSKFGLFDNLAQRKPISIETYERLHDKKQGSSLNGKPNHFVLSQIKTEPAELYNARFYTFQ